MASVTLGYKLKLFPSRCKSDTLAALAALFQRVHTDVTNQLACAESPNPLSSKGKGGFIGRAYRRAYIDYRRTIKSGHTPGPLKAELIDSAKIQQPRKAKGFDCWVMLRGTTTTPGRNGGFYVPARKHRAINRTLALPGATLNESAEVFRKNGKWYARVSVTVPLAQVQDTQGIIGVDVGVRSCVVRSDGHKGRDLRPILDKQRDRRAMQQKHGLDKRSNGTFQKQLLCYEARLLVSVALATGRAIAVEDPKRLIRWKGHAARFFGYRVALLAAIVGVPCLVVNPAYSSTTCPHCGEVERGMRHRGAFRCWRCGYTHNADFVASLNICHWGHRGTAVSHGLLSLCSGEGTDRQVLV